jgi:hypothetical protein
MLLETGCECRINLNVLLPAGTFLYKGVQFAAIGFAAGLVGTGMTNLLLKVRFLRLRSEPFVLFSVIRILHSVLYGGLQKTQVQSPACFDSKSVFLGITSVSIQNP